MLPAFEKQLNRDLAPIWGTQQVQIVFAPKGTKPPAGSGGCLSRRQRSGRRARLSRSYREGLPISKVFVRTPLQQDGASISVGATHELCEMMVDPWLNGAYEDLHGTFWAAECADPFEADEYGYKIDNVLVTDFATPKMVRVPARSRLRGFLRALQTAVFGSVRRIRPTAARKRRLEAGHRQAGKVVRAIGCFGRHPARSAASGLPRLGAQRAEVPVTNQ